MNKQADTDELKKQIDEKIKQLQKVPDGRNIFNAMIEMMADNMDIPSETLFSVLKIFINGAIAMSVYKGNDIKSGHKIAEMRFIVCDSKYVSNSKDIDKSPYGDLIRAKFSHFASCPFATYKAFLDNHPEVFKDLKTEYPELKVNQDNLSYYLDAGKKHMGIQVTIFE